MSVLHVFYGKIFIIKICSESSIWLQIVNTTKGHQVESTPDVDLLLIPSQAYENIKLSLTNRESIKILFLVHVVGIRLNKIMSTPLQWVLNSRMYVPSNSGMNVPSIGILTLLGIFNDFFLMASSTFFIAALTYLSLDMHQHFNPFGNVFCTSCAPRYESGTAVGPIYPVLSRIN